MPSYIPREYWYLTSTYHFVLRLNFTTILGLSNRGVQQQLNLAAYSRLLNYVARNTSPLGRQRTSNSHHTARSFMTLRGVSSQELQPLILLLPLL